MENQHPIGGANPRSKMYVKTNKTWKHGKPKTDWRGQAGTHETNKRVFNTNPETAKTWKRRKHKNKQPHAQDPKCMIKQTKHGNTENKKTIGGDGDEGR